ncbi:MULTISPECIES: TIM barrel protein [Micromonospora]|uniref:Xylose isomerase-like TIM barrel domain-containing protein n=1 Tax=Micromonospora solifontis TaxID=2487138 RepID=A0ABX9WH50_9ACTN|nr:MULTISPECIES: TIM barrel protein [Micromonospora]NES15988.1 hypothetical protein [Micromonospora sp. PPF5-17B]NES36591.1 hypothetical protein [Micromonospora solifontis]NES57341.1 hypothetical protein [Micromonospora sp. PPF5-6]RNL99329.1 hypothetical protein EFE23_10525 [Micromonospora solifontis]
MANWVVSLTGPRRVSLEPCPADPLGPARIRVRTCYSGISAGTELTLYRGSNPRLSKDWDDATGMFVPRQAAPAYPVIGFGYEEVGEVVEVASDVTDRRPGQVVWGIWGHRAEAVVAAGAVAPLAPGLDPLPAALRAAAPYLGHVQVSDSNRYQPGAGHLDWAVLLRTLDEIGYPGWLALECRLRGEPVAALRQAATVLRQAGPRRAAA